MQRAVRTRRMFGGAMRQSGLLAAAGLYALDKNLARLAEDHANARILATRLADTRVTIDLDGTDQHHHLSRAGAVAGCGDRGTAGAGAGRAGVGIRDAN